MRLTQDFNSDNTYSGKPLPVAVCQARDSRFDSNGGMLLVFLYYVSEGSNPQCSQDIALIAAAAVKPQQQVGSFNLAKKQFIARNASCSEVHHYPSEDLVGAALPKSLTSGGDRAAGHVPTDWSCSLRVPIAARLNSLSTPVSRAFIFWQNKESPCKNN